MKAKVQHIIYSYFTLAHGPISVRNASLVFTLALTLSFTSVLTSCQSDELDALSSSTQESKLQTITFRATVGGTSADSRAQVLLDNQDASTEYFLWNEGDSISVYDLGADGTSVPAYGQTFGITDYSDASPSSTASFTGEGGIEVGNAILAVYPAQAAAATEGSITLAIDDSISLGTYTDEAIEAYMASQMYMYATATMTDGDTDLAFNHLTSMLRLTYRNATDTIQSLSSVEVTNSSGIFGAVAKLDLATASTSVTATTTTLQQTFDPISVAVGDSIDFYLLFFPGNTFDDNTIDVSIGDVSTSINPTLFANSSNFYNETFATGARYWLDLTHTATGLDRTGKYGETDDYVILYSSTNLQLGAALTQLFGSEGVYRDGNLNAHIPKSLIERTTTIDFTSVRAVEQMYNLSGLEIFANLDTLYCNRTQAVTLSGFPKLDYVNCYYSHGILNLESVNISDCPSLTTLIVDGGSCSEFNITNCPNLSVLDFSNAGGIYLTSLDVTACTELTTLNCCNCYNLPSLDVTGLTKLETLDLTNCTGLTSLDVSTLASLVTLDCTGCTSLTSLDVSGLNSLETLECEWTTYHDMTLTSINAAGCTSLSTLNCHGDTGLTTLDLTGCKVLTTLDCGWCGNLTSDFDLSDCKSLEYVDFSECYNFTTLLLSGCTALTTVDLEDCSALTTLDLTGCKALTSLILKSCNKMSSELDLSGCTELTELNLNQCHALSILNLSGCTSLTGLSSNAWPGNITHLNTSNCTALEYVYAGSKTEELNIEGCTAMTKLTLDRCIGITQLDISGLKSLETLDNTCQYLKELDASNLTNLKTLTVGPDTDGIGHGLTKLDVSNCTALETISCHGYNSRNKGALTGINLTNCTALKYLDVSCNELSNLDVSDCTAIETLYCNDNDLLILGLSPCTALQYFNCCDNELSALDVTNCTGLENLYCSSNRIALLDLTQCTSLRIVECYSNHLSSIDISKCSSLSKCKCYGQTNDDGDSITISVYLTETQAERFTDTHSGTVSYVTVD